MVWLAKTSTLVLLTLPAIVSSIALPRDPIPAANVVSRRDETHLPIAFRAVCNGCFDGADSEVVFNLDILSTKSVCGESSIRLNGRVLNLTWDGITAAGETSLTAKLSNGKEKADFLLNSRALCIASRENSTEDYAAQILAVTFYPAGRVNEDNDTSGFAFSFNSVGKPEVFRLVTSPVSYSAQDESFESWLDSSGSDQFQVQNGGMSEAGQIDDLEEELQQLHKLKQEAQKLQNLIKDKDEKIRTHLLHNCMCLSSRLKSCKNLKCFVEASFKFVPGIFQLMKYRFGTLPSTLAGIPCRPLVREWANQTSTTNLDPPYTPSNSSRVTIGNKPGLTIQRLPNTPALSRPFKPRPMRHMIGDVAVMGLLIVIITVLLKKCNSLSCRRRRVDLAARREERRTRHAYRAAACRYKMRLWWSGLRSSLLGIPNTRPSPTHVRYHDPNSDPNTFTGARRPGQPSESTMRNEIIGFRRALEYVGQLVHVNNSNGQEDSGDIADINVRRGPAGPPTVISSVAPLPTIGSPRTSTVFSYDETDDSGTIESIDLETATMLSG
ncbi:predicted protein [Uncinocarpus reesii 1704]|uniref:Uncharacterized protein n=1 Tax=Uncinocarpus reesii (strain UAMH 1704) TaxID=336963 RepID=C4JXD7_UNCRE|nr:uncharacterized protein UREG_06310 [Uncinocarpus reesii 1704]EEP81445.1 predicted protein [Uncinocarpus reesii 1704]